MPGWRLRPGGRFPAGVALLILALGPLAASGQGIIRNLARVTYADALGQPGPVALDSAVIRYRPSGGGGLLMSFTASRERVTPGDTLAYTLSYRAEGTSAFPGVEFGVLVPVGTRLLEGTLRWREGAGVHVEVRSDTLLIAAGDLMPGDSGRVWFTVDVRPAPGQEMLAGRAWQRAPVAVGTLRSDVQVLTPIQYASLSIANRLEGPDSARVGDEVRYTIHVANRAAVEAREVVVLDSLPEVFAFAGAQPAPLSVGASLARAGSRDGGAEADRMVTWALGTMPPGDSVRITVVVVVVRAEPDSTRTRAVARVRALNGATQGTATARAVIVAPAGSPRLRLAFATEALEVGVGEAVPFTLRVANQGSAPVVGAGVDVDLADGLGFVASSLRGAAVAEVTEDGTRLRLQGVLEPGAERVLRFQATLVSADEAVLTSRATAFADEAVPVETATASVGVRRGFAMETRAEVGRVWGDENGNGVQDPGEGGIADVDVWTDDGEVVRTDAEGKFSLVNVRPGGHALRVDPATLPEGTEVPAGEEMVAFRATGWTTPQVLFRLVPGRPAPPDAARATLGDGPVATPSRPIPPPPLPP
ncbi:MAG: DUF11 domain-containing protein, partial [Gemmatimonadetes bacterium]|nr:DUF11 domain-containing protein [Gemmatimonadota bacterium]